MIPSISTRRLSLLTLGLALSQALFAAQTVELTDGQSGVARISQKEPTRIAVDGGRIVNVTGNIVADKNPDGEIAIEKDEARGQLYVRPRDNGKTKPVKLFISTDKATYTLVLQPTDMPADTVMIKDKSEKAGKDSGSLERAGTRKAVVKLLITAMLTGIVPDGVDVRDVGQDVRLWQESRFTLEQVYSSRSLVGEKYRLTNVSKAPLVMEEPEFYRDNVVGVTVENQNLPPGANTRVLIVKERQP